MISASWSSAGSSSIYLTDMAGVSFVVCFVLYGYSSVISELTFTILAKFTVDVEAGCSVMSNSFRVITSTSADNLVLEVPVSIELGVVRTVHEEFGLTRCPPFDSGG